MLEERATNDIFYPQIYWSPLTRMYGSEQESLSLTFAESEHIKWALAWLGFSTWIDCCHTETVGSERGQFFDLEINNIESVTLFWCKPLCFFVFLDKQINHISFFSWKRCFYMDVRALNSFKKQLIKKKNGFGFGRDLC